MELKEIMENKEIIHNEIEICKLSKAKIDTTKDDYSILLDCRGKDIHSVGFYKNQILRDTIKGNLKKVQQEIMKMAKGLTGGILSKLLPKKEVYSIA